MGETVIVSRELLQQLLDNAERSLTIIQNLRTAQQVQQEQEPVAWQGLTEEEIIEAVRESDLDWHRGWTLEDGEPNRYTKFARAIEAKLKEKNQ